MLIILMCKITRNIWYGKNHLLVTLPSLTPMILPSPLTAAMLEPSFAAFHAIPVQSLYLGIDNNNNNNKYILCHIGS